MNTAAVAKPVKLPQSEKPALASGLSAQSTEFAGSAGDQIRSPIRSGHFTNHTSGLSRDLVQGNVVILPQALATDFLRYCQRNPKPCPLLAVSEPGDPMLPTLGRDIDIRSDVPRYRVWRSGELVDEPTNVSALWRDDLVTFVIGCSFSFEQALLDSGIPLRHVEQKRNVAMYRSNIATTAAGPFSGPMVVSMRPMKAADAIRAIQITSRFPNVHGAPVHIGNPELIGIDDLSQPHYGDPVEVKADELPVFWACGVTPQAAITQARPEFCITHAPGAMLITDLLNHQLASF
ncbi:MAG: putative hydro-lyase [Rhizobacter sp.]